MKKTKWIRVGSVAVDSGSIIIGDPCYMIPSKEDFNSEEWFKNHTEYRQVFDEQLHKNDPKWEKQVGQVLLTDIAGFGVLTHTFDGDGIYDVFVKKDLETGRVTEIKVKFI